MRHYASRCQGRLYFHEFTSQPGSVATILSGGSDAPYSVSAPGIRQKTLYYSRGMRNIRHPEPFLKKVIIVTADTPPRTDRQRHLASGSLYPALANNCSSLRASNCPLGLAFLLEHQSKEKPEQGEAASDSRPRVPPNIVSLWISAQQTTQRSRLQVLPPRKTTP